MPCKNTARSAKPPVAAFQRVYPHVFAAARESVDMHEQDVVTYFDALRAATRLFLASRDVAFRGPGDPTNRYDAPSTAMSHDAQKLFKYNYSVQAVLVERDPLLPEADNWLRGLIKTGTGTTILTFRKMLPRFLHYAYNHCTTNKDRGRDKEFRVHFMLPRSGHQHGRSAKKYGATFPCSRWHAVFVSLYSLWRHLPAAPENSLLELWGTRHR